MPESQPKSTPFDPLLLLVTTEEWAELGVVRNVNVVADARIIDRGVLSYSIAYTLITAWFANWPSCRKPFE